MNRIYVARHGQSTWNAERRWAGHADPPLSELGRAQARDACEAFRDHRFDSVTSSGLVRAIDTAAILAAALGVPQLEPRRALNERFAGPISGMTPAELEAHLPGFMEQWRSGVAVEIPGGEPWQEFVERVCEGFRRLQTISGRTLVISHMGVQRAIEHSLGKPPGRYRNLEGFWVPRSEHA